MKFLVVLLAVGTATAADPVSTCRGLDRHGKRNEAKSCFQNLAKSSNPAHKAEALWALGDFESANNEFKLAVAQQPKNPEIRTRWGRLFLERFNPAEAQN